jgi:hypothetical protein
MIIEQETSPLTDSAVESTERLQEIAADFSRTVRELQRKSVARVSEAYNTYVTTLARTQHESQQQTQDLLRTYSAASRDAAYQLDALKQHEQAYSNYLEMLRNAHDEADKRHQEAVRKCAASLLQARDKARAESTEAYRTYLQSLKETWTNVDVDEIVTATAPNIQAY